MNEPEKIRSLYNKLINGTLYQFPKKGKLQITCRKGVYIIYDASSEVVHVGNTPRGVDGLCQRLNNHIYKSSSFAKGYLRPNNLSVRMDFSYRLLEVSSPRDRALLEALGCGLLCPKHIGTGESRIIS